MKPLEESEPIDFWAVVAPTPYFHERLVFHVALGPAGGLKSEDFRSFYRQNCHFLRHGRWGCTSLRLAALGYYGCFELNLTMTYYFLKVSPNI